MLSLWLKKSARIVVLVTAARAATPAEIPVLEQKLAHASAQERPAMLLELADAAELSDIPRAFAAAKEARELAREPEQRLQALALVASMTRDVPDYPEALRLAREGLAEATTAKNVRLQARFDYIIARTQWGRGDYPAAVASFHEAIRLGEQTGDPAVRVDAHTGLAVIYLEFRQLDNAQFQVEKARAAVAQLSDSAREANFQRILGNYLRLRGDFPGARVAYERSLQVSTEGGLLRRTADALLVLATLDETERRYQDGRERNLAALALYDQLGLKLPATSAHRQLGVVLSRLGRTAEGLEQIKIAFQVRRDLGLEDAALLYRDRAVIQEAAGNLQAALKDQREAQVRNDHVFSERIRQQLAVLTARYDAERRQHEIDALKSEQALKAAAFALKDTELARARWQRYGLLGIMFFGGLAAAAVVSRQRTKLASERRVHEETRAARQAAEDASQLKTRLLGIASHDIRAPLAAMVAGAREIAQNPHDAALAAALGSGLDREGERLLALLRDLLDVSAIESGRLEFTPAPCDLVALVGERIDAHRAAAAAKGQGLIYEAPSEALVVSADRARLAQVFDNLLSNAVKFTPPGGSIIVSVVSAHGRATARVRDSGPGLRPEDLAQLFQPFRTLSAQPTAGEPSSGLGLFIAQDIVTRHGGGLGVDSMPGEGATFIVELPLVAGAPAPIPPRKLKICN